MITLQKVEKINHELYFSTNSILNKSEVKKIIRKIKGPETNDSGHEFEILTMFDIFF